MTSRSILCCLSQDSSTVASAACLVGSTSLVDMAHDINGNDPANTHHAPCERSSLPETIISDTLPHLLSDSNGIRFPELFSFPSWRAGDETIERNIIQAKFRHA